MPRISSFSPTICWKGAPLDARRPAGGAGPATALRQLGYEPAGENGTFFQDVPVVESIVDPSFLLTAGSGAPFKYLQDVVAFSGVQDPQVRSRGR